MVSHSSIHTILYAVGIVLAILTWTLSAGIVADYNDAFSYVSGTFNAANATLAWGLISMLYYIAALAILFFVSSYNPAVCIIADTCCIGFLWIFGIGSVGSLSTVISWFRVASDYGLTFGGVGQAAVAFGWLLVFLQLGTLLYEVIFTLVHYGGSLDVWRQSFHDITTTGTRVVRGEKGPQPGLNMATNDVPLQTAPQV
ncbi:uncharacterized protein EHS24_008462 [Apiotrichum porosum]|uniref:MARVEL domain-containing protein n=1 Tax=Apiotrichum porosum TaxID=105984 RepID=A0A427XQE9_9TREE|nr:uncharacterized protein EHS24_008462 [Apiotrichum porosum]RSH81028.1 hypothetical protein EHS24_008462 [Apiotrichum porosum]